MLKKSSLGALRLLYRFGISPALDTLTWARRSWQATVGLALFLTVGTAYLALLLMAHNAYAGWAEPVDLDTHAKDARPDVPAAIATVHEPIVEPIDPMDPTIRPSATASPLPHEPIGPVPTNPQATAKPKATFGD
jgi:hypothetical protein